MTLDMAMRFTEVLLAFALIQQSSEHLSAPKDEQRLFLPRFALGFLLMLGVWSPWVCLALLLHSLFILKRFQGPYNGGSDKMSLLILCALCLARFMPSLEFQEYVFGYLAFQVVLSYFISGWVKIVNPQWRSGNALRDVFCFSAYPVSESIRGWADKPRLLCFMSWAVMLFELVFPFALFTQPTLVLALVIAATFHFANACLFGLNRFFWVWVAAYPSLLWLQSRVFEFGG